MCFCQAWETMHLYPESFFFLIVSFIALLGMSELKKESCISYSTASVFTNEVHVRWLNHPFLAASLGRRFSFYIGDWQLSFSSVHTTIVAQGKGRSEYCMEPESLQLVPEEGQMQRWTNFWTPAPNFILRVYLQSFFLTGCDWKAVKIRNQNVLSLRLISQVNEFYLLDIITCTKVQKLTIENLK